MRHWYRSILSRGQGLIYSVPAPPAARILIDLLIRTFRNFSRDDGSHMAAGVAYYAIFSLFPLALAAVAIGGFVLSAPHLQEELFRFLDSQLPVSGDSTLIEDNIEQIINARATLGLLAGVTLLWSGRTVFGAVHRVVNRAWKVTESPHFLLHQLAQVTAAVGAVALFAASTTLSTFVRTFVDTHILPGAIPWALGLSVLPFLMSTLLLLLVYKIVPDTPVRWPDALPPAIVAGVAFEIVKAVFSYYLANLSNLDLVYGSITTIVALMLFLYIVALILVLGAELSSEINRTSKAGLLNIRGHLRPVAGGLRSHMPSAAKPAS